MPEYLTRHFSLQEMIRSAYAARMGLDNAPSSAQRANLVRVCEVLEICREILGGHSLYVSSGLRKGQVNDGQGGATRSAHKYGLAADIDNLRVEGKAGNHEAFQKIAPLVLHQETPIDQLIGEFFLPDEPHAGWIHIGLAREQKSPRYQILRAYRDEARGRTRYASWQNPWQLP